MWFSFHFELSRNPLPRIFFSFYSTYNINYQRLTGPEWIASTGEWLDFPTTQTKNTLIPNIFGERLVFPQANLICPSEQKR